MKTSVLTTLILLILAVVIFYIFNITLSKPSFDINFSPGKEIAGSEIDHKDEIPQNIIVFIADGMGFGHLSIALMTQQSEDKSSVWDEFEVRGWHDARSGYGPLTDSEASATAISTGTSTQFGHIGIDGKLKPLENIFEMASDSGYHTGIVTDSYIWDGTPAAFVAHTRNEDDARDIMMQMASSELDLIFGELEDLGEDDVPEKAETMDILKKRFLLLDRSLTLPDLKNPPVPVAAIFEEDEVQDTSSSPNLTQLTEVALRYLSSTKEPFVLLVESEEMDPASHENDSRRVINGLQSIQKTLEYVLDFSKSNGETLVIFTSDHETGGLAAVADFDRYPKLQIKWTTRNHTAAVVPLFAAGPGADHFAQVRRNWEIGYILKKLITKDFFTGTTVNEDSKGL